LSCLYAVSNIKKIAFRIWRNCPSNLAPFINDMECYGSHFITYLPTTMKSENEDLDEQLACINAVITKNEGKTHE
jgi:hypothetical protein